VHRSDHDLREGPDRLRGSRRAVEFRLHLEQGRTPTVRQLGETGFRPQSQQAESPLGPPMGRQPRRSSNTHRRLSTIRRRIENTSLVSPQRFSGARTGAHEAKPSLYFRTTATVTVPQSSSTCGHDTQACRARSDATDHLIAHTATGGTVRPREQMGSGRTTTCRASDGLSVNRCIKSGLGERRIAGSA
jgi:hypothetical protein